MRWIRKTNIVVAWFNSLDGCHMLNGKASCNHSQTSSNNLQLTSCSVSWPRKVLNGNLDSVSVRYYRGPPPPERQGVSLVWWDCDVSIQVDSIRLFFCRGQEFHELELISKQRPRKRWFRHKSTGLPRVEYSIWFKTIKENWGHGCVLSRRKFQWAGSCPRWVESHQLSSICSIGFFSLSQWQAQDHCRELARWHVMDWA